MKQFFLSIFAWLFCLAVFAQAKPFYSQYILNNYILNPGITGIENYTDVKLSYRNQWSGINGAPITTYFTIHGPVGKHEFKTSPTSFQVPGDNPRGKGYTQDYESTERHHGVGFTAINDKVGYFNRWSIAANYAYHIPVSQKFTVAAGFSAGITSVNIDRSKIDFGNMDPNDPAIGYTNGEIKKLKPEIGVGIWLYGARAYAGISVLNIIPGKAKFVNSDKFGTYFTPNYFATAGYKFFISDDVSLLPSVMVQYWQPQLTGLHVNAKLQYKDFLWIGASYRHANLVGGYSGMLGVNISNTFNISYAYENANTSRLQGYTKGTHEIMLGFIIGNKYGDICPRNVW